MTPPYGHTRTYTVVARRYCDQLASLKLVGCRVTDDGLRAVLRACLQLRELCITDNELISDASLKHMHEDSLLTRKPPTSTSVTSTSSLAHASEASQRSAGEFLGAVPSGTLHRQPSEMRRIAAL